MNFLIIIRGPLGIGKSTIAKNLALKLNGDYISVDDILAQNNLDQIDEKEGCIPLANFLKVNELILSRLKSVSQSGKPMIVDGNFYHQQQIEDLVQKSLIPSYVFTLTAPLETCIQRDEQRQKSYGKEATVAVYSLVSKFNYGQVIETSTLSAEETIELILSGLKK
jgi:predicted kinase